MSRVREKLNCFLTRRSFFTIKVCVAESCVGSVSINLVKSAMNGLLMHDEGEMMRELTASLIMAVYSSFFCYCVYVCLISSIRASKNSI